MLRRRLLNVFVLACLLWVGAALGAEEPDDLGSYQQAYLYWQYGYGLHMIGEYDKAVVLFTKSIELYPTAEGHTYLGWSLSELGLLDEAIAECQKAIALDPDYGNPYNDIGVYLIELDRLDEAIPWLEKAMAAKRYCCYEYPHFNLGRILLAKGRIEEARRSFERALSYDPDYQPALKGVQILRAQGETL